MIRSGLASEGVLVLSLTTTVVKEFLILNIYALLCVYFWEYAETGGKCEDFRCSWKLRIGILLWPNYLPFLLPLPLVCNIYGLKMRLE